MSADASKPRLSVTGDPKDYEPTYGNPQCYTKLDNAVEKQDAGTVAAGGVHAPLKIGQVGANVYPGRPLPKAEAVTTAQCVPGKAKAQADKQLKEQRQDLK